jgi:hypothetical protein
VGSSCDALHVVPVHSEKQFSRPLAGQLSELTRDMHTTGAGMYSCSTGEQVLCYQVPSMVAVRKADLTLRAARFRVERAKKKKTVQPPRPQRAGGGG